MATACSASKACAGRRGTHSSSSTRTPAASSACASAISLTNASAPFEKASSYHVLAPLIGDRIDVAQIESQWDELLRLATSIRQGTVTASLVLRKLASYPRQNG